MASEQVPGERFCLWDRAAIEGVLDRMALEAAALLRGEEDPLLLGILRRGAPFAQMLQSRLLRRDYGLDIPRYGLKLKRYGDDLALVHPDTELTENAEFSARELARATVLVVDDVLYRGHSLARVLAYVSQRRAPVIRAAVLAIAASRSCRSTRTSSASGCRWRRATSSSATSRPTKTSSGSSCCDRARRAKPRGRAKVGRARRRAREVHR